MMDAGKLKDLRSALPAATTTPKLPEGMPDVDKLMRSQRGMVLLTESIPWRSATLHHITGKAHIWILCVPAPTVGFVRTQLEKAGARVWSEHGSNGDIRGVLAAIKACLATAYQKYGNTPQGDAACERIAKQVGEVVSTKHLPVFLSVGWLEL